MTMRFPWLALPLIFAGSWAQADSAPPDWLTAHMAFLSQGTGCWVTSNADYQSEQEPFDSYYNEWHTGIGGVHHLNGRLYGQTGDQPSANFWDFLSYWDGNRGKAITMQFGHNGVVGDGSIWQADEHDFVQEQLFSLPDGRTWKSRHTIKQTGDSLITTSFDWQDEQWEQRRTYTWHRCNQ